MLLVVLFGVGTDYILFLMFRYREQLRVGEDPKQAIVTAVARVGKAISTAAGGSIIAFLAMLLSVLTLFHSMGVSLAIGVAATLVAGLTLVPAVVSLLGAKVFWPSRAWQREPHAARFSAVGIAMARRPAAFAVVSGVAMVALAIGAVGTRQSFDFGSGLLPETAESQVARENLEKGLPPGATAPTEVYLRSDLGQPLTEADLSRYAEQLSAVDGVGQVTPAQLSQDRTAARLTVALTSNPTTVEAMDVVREPLRDTAHAAAPAGTTALVGGTTSVFVDLQAAINRDYLVMFPVAAVLITATLAMLLRSLVAPWYLMAAVGLGFTATMGATTLVFQNVLGEGGLIFHIVLVMYMFVVALGTDYNILMMARLHEEALHGRSPRAALAIAMRHTGPTIAAAGLILAGSFAMLLLAGLLVGASLFAQMGFAISIGIAVAAFVMAMFFTPSLTALIGHRAWWPGRGDAPEPPVATPKRAGWPSEGAPVRKR